MAKTLNEAKLTTRNARAQLAVGLYWRGLDQEVHLGYRKAKRGGVWLVRWRNGSGYRQARIGGADDVIVVGTLSFEAAVKAARAIVERVRTDAAARAAGAPVMVGTAVENYVKGRDVRDSKWAGRLKRSDAGHRLGRYVTGRAARGKQPAVAAAPLASIPLHSLKEADLLAWREGLRAELKDTTRQRLVNDLKAALNGAYADRRESLPPALPGIIRHGLRALQRDDRQPIARDNQILSDSEVARILRAAREVDREFGWDGDLFRVVLVLAATGARFSQVARMQVGDCQTGAGRLMVPVSRKGRGKAGSITVPVGRDVLDALSPVVADRHADAPLLERWRYVQMKGRARNWVRDRRGPWQTPSEFDRPWRENIRGRAGLPNAIPYSLRHSSIVKGIRANLPIRLVAALHDTSTAMIERHYARWITSGLEELARSAIVPLVPDEAGGVVHLPLRAR